MRRKKNISRRQNQQGIIITLVAVFMLGVIGAMAALSIDVVTLYTARSEAQLAADGAALAGARVLANSGMTSASDLTVGVNAIPLAVAVATQVAANNPVGGRDLIPGSSTCVAGQEICVSINQALPNFLANPQVTVSVQRADLPTFFARIWGRATLTVGASATAEAYNPSNVPSTSSALPVAPMCVKPWLLPNIDPTSGSGSRIFDPTTGAIVATPTLLGYQTPTGGGLGATRLRTDCTTCTNNSGPTVWRYYPGTTDSAGDFPAPSASSVACPGCTGFTAYQLSIAGCVQTPISCSSPAASPVHVDTTPYPTRDTEAGTAVDDMTHSTANGGDSVDTTAAPSPPFQFLAGTENPVVQSGALTSGANIMVSDSLVTVPVINVDSGTALPIPNFPNVQIIGFVQLFLNPTGQPSFNGHIHTKVVNLIGCGSGMATLQPILGNGSTAVPVRLISQ